MTWTDFPEDSVLPGGLRAGFGAASIATTPTKLIAVSSNPATYRTFDGNTWTENSFGPGYTSLSRVTYGGGRFALVGWGCCDEAAGTGLRATSADGENWALRTNATPPVTNFRFGNVIWDGTRYFATASQYDRRVYASADGLDFQEINIDVGLGPVVFWDGAYVAAGAGTMYRSTNGTAWTATLEPEPSIDFGFVNVSAGRVLKP